MKRIAVIGAGSWGTALAIIAGRAGHDVRLWSRNDGVVADVNERRVNSAYLSSAEIPARVRATNEFGEAMERAEIVILASPSHATRSLLNGLLPHAQPRMVFVSATKGIEVETGKRISEIVDDVFGSSFRPRFVCLSGPSFAKEVATGQPTAVVAASSARGHARAVQSALSFQNLRIYTNKDVVGTEFGGSLKNVIAVAAGMVSGLGLGTNSVAALITRGLAEMARLALKQGARRETLMGLAGLGDLVLTCTGGLSRNRFVGQELGKGRDLADIVGSIHEVAEGVKTTHAVKLLAESVGVEMPITNEVYSVLYEGKSAKDAATELMSRPLKGEFEK